MVASGSEGIRVPTFACPTGLALQTVALMHWMGMVVAALGSSFVLSTFALV
jgi:hypothetical protein